MQAPSKFACDYYMPLVQATGNMERYNGNISALSTEEDLKAPRAGAHACCKGVFSMHT
jgi:hypothetical protein